MWAWIRANAGAVEAMAAVVMALVALAALVGVKLQIDATERLQREQVGREIYREFLLLSVQNPVLASGDHCALSGTVRTAYESYVEYLLYTAEQVIEMDNDWRAPMRDTLSAHQTYVCERSDSAGYSDTVNALIDTVRTSCEAVPACSGDEDEN